MTVSRNLALEIVKRFKERGYAQVEGYRRFGFMRLTEDYVVVSPENGKDSKIPISKIIDAIEAVRRDPAVYSKGPSELRRHGLTHITSPLWSLLHLLSMDELKS